jgi:hypothetical protein
MNETNKQPKVKEKKSKKIIKMKKVYRLYHFAPAKLQNTFYLKVFANFFQKL